MNRCGPLNYKELPCYEYRPTVLIAQADEESLSELIYCCNRFNKFDVHTAITGQEVVDMVNETCYDAIILGLKFPDITGSTIAYLIHKFDPLVSVAFLSKYKSDILIAVAQDLGFTFWNKTEKYQDLDSFVKEIYELSLSMPCDAEKRIIKREYMKPEREEYLKYGKLSIPNSIQQVLEERELEFNHER